MAILWKRSRPYAEFLPRHHPAAGLLAGDEDLRAAGNFAFSLVPDPLPALRRIAPDVLAALEERHRALGSPPEVFASLRLLADGAAAVVTGQQAGLLGGPLFTLLKTLTAVRIARELTARHGRPFVPVFWSETEDHDLDEVNQAWTFGAPGPAASRCPWPTSTAARPWGRSPLGGGGRASSRSSSRPSPATEFTPALVEGLLADLDRSPDWGTWFARHLERLFGRHGLVVADSLEPRLAACARLLWARVLEEPLALTGTCQERGRWLAGLGYKPILQKMEQRTPFFLLEAGKRLPVTFERGLFRTPHADHTLPGLLRRLDEGTGDFSAAVHLRPHLQDFLLPTAAYIAGPTELAYFLQLLPGYRVLGIPAPTIVLRASLTLVETDRREDPRAFRDRPRRPQRGDRPRPHHAGAP